MVLLFFRQLAALVWKNWIVLSRHPLLNLIRCLALPVGYGVFMGYAQLLLAKVNNYGLGTMVPVHNLVDVFDGSMSLVWVDATNTTSSPTASDIMAHVTQGFSANQLAAVQQLDSPDDIPNTCPENFRLYSPCFAGIVFNDLPGMPTAEQVATDPQHAMKPYNYTLRGDGGLFYINVVQHTSDFEERLFPLQWAVDSAIIELVTGVEPLTPLEWPFTQETNAEQYTDIRLSFVRGTRELLVLALFICFVPIAYHLPGSFMGERANLLTSHMKAMGLYDSARYLSWYFSVSLAYIPGWVVIAIIWHLRIFSATSVGVLIAVHILFGLSLAGWSLFISIPFGKSPQLAAVTATFASVGLAVLALVFARFVPDDTGTMVAFTLLFPPGFFVFAIYAICGFENNQMPANLLQPDPDNHIMLWPLFAAAAGNIILWPMLAVVMEKVVYDSHNLFRRTRPRSVSSGLSLRDDIAISIRHLGKDFQTSRLRLRRGRVTAIADLTLEIPKTGIHVLLGSNGAGKSTTMAILAGLTGRSRGNVLFEGGAERPSRGTIGIVPQKNVLFPELTCYQTLRVFEAIKSSSGRSRRDDSVEHLLRDCDLEKKIHSNANSLSGGQKRRLQLAIGLIGGSSIVLVDECTSGVDPLSRRAIWRILNSVRHDRTVVFTTHFLDEANLLADTIAVLKAPGKLVAHGTPVSLKSRLGEGYIVQVTFDFHSSVFSASLQHKDSMFSLGTFNAYKQTLPVADELVDIIRPIAPLVYASVTSPQEVLYHLRSKDPRVVQQVLMLIDMDRAKYSVASYAIHGTSLEDIFLTLMNEEDDVLSADNGQSVDLKMPKEPDSRPNSLVTSVDMAPIDLTDGRERSFLAQAFTIFYKRVLIFRRSWLAPLFAIAVAAAGSGVPLIFLAGRVETCVNDAHSTFTAPLYYPESPISYSVEDKTTPGKQLLESPPGILASVLGPTVSDIDSVDVGNNATLVDDIYQNYLNMSVGGISVDLRNGSVLVAWEASEPGFMGLVMVNLASNVIFSNATRNTGISFGLPTLITPQFQNFPGPNFDTGTLIVLKWIAFFGASMAAYPAFFSLYVSKERRSSVQAMQFSNGLTNPAGLWLGHLMFDSLFAILAGSIIIIVFQTLTNQFSGLGFLWVVFALYGISSVLFSYCAALLTPSPLAAFALTACYQSLIFLGYFAANLIALTFASPSQSSDDVNIINFTVSILAPVASVLRATFISVNLFSLLCNGDTPATTSQLGGVSRFGGPILYLALYSAILFAILVFVDSGSLLRGRRRGLNNNSNEGLLNVNDVQEEANTVTSSNNADPLRVLGVTKVYGKNKVVDDVTFGVGRDNVLALLGPNGAGKTTTFNMIRGDVLPDSGDIRINGTSVLRHPREARMSLGVCPQFTAIDSQLTVEEHLMHYGRLKGLRSGRELRQNVQRLLKATSLDLYARRLTAKLSGGNQRKLALAISLIGNPSVVLIDEFSSGVDAKMKRDMWATLRKVSGGKAIVITTHSMEEAAALASKVGILAKKMLAVGTCESLAARYATYEVQFSCRTREEIILAQQLMAQLPGARMADDVATRFQVPIGPEMSLAQLFTWLSLQDMFTEYSVEQATLETVFLKVIRENAVREEDEEKEHWWNVA